MSDHPRSEHRRHDSAHDILRSRKHPLDVFFAPKSVVLVGATEHRGTVGRTLMWNLVTNPFGGTVFPVNPKRASVLGVKAYPTIADLPEQPELAVIVTPAPTIPSVIRECADMGVKGAIVISSGFKEIGPDGLKLEQDLLAEARRGGMRIIGPNCLGVMNPSGLFNATFAHTTAMPGRVAFISQSGALCTAVLDWSLKEKVGFSGFVSIGSMSDVGWGDLIDYFGHDPNTDSILLYMESVGDARTFLSVTREVALTKPIIVIKVGRTAQAARAAASHTGTLTGSDDVLDAAFRRCGVLRVNRISDLFHMAEVLSRQPRPRGPHLTIVSNAGGPGVLATDALIQGGGELTELSRETVEQLDPLLPSAWSHNNPIDIIGDAAPDRYAKALAIAARDPNADGMLVILTPQDMTDPTATAECLRPYAKIPGKPVLASWMGGLEVAQGVSILNQAGIPTFEYPDAAAHAFVYMWQFAQNRKQLYETPSLPPAGDAVDRQKVIDLVERTRFEGHRILNEFDSKEMLAAYGIPTVPTVIARTLEDAVEASERFGYPVVLKVLSQTVMHKTDVNGVRLGLSSPEGVRVAYRSIASSVTERLGADAFQGVTVQPLIRNDGYEVILGACPDPQFGPVLLFGTGGQLVEVLKDRALGLPPLTTTLARRMMEQTKIYKALRGIRGRKPVDLSALEQLMVRFSQLVVEQPLVREIEINPLLVSSDGSLALDATVTVYAKAEEREIPRPAIAPYPIQYVGRFKSNKGIDIVIRPIRPEDEPALVRFHGQLSETTVYQRYAEALKLSIRTAHERLTRICFIDYALEIKLVAEVGDEIAGVARLDRVPGNVGEIAVVLCDRWQRQGIGPELIRRLIPIARDLGMVRLSAEMLPGNHVMARLFQKLGFRVQPDDDGSRRYAELALE